MAWRWRIRCSRSCSRLALVAFLPAALRSFGTSGRLFAACATLRLGVGRFLAPGRSTVVVLAGVPPLRRPTVRPAYLARGRAGAARVSLQGHDGQPIAPVRTPRPGPPR